MMTNTQQEETIQCPSILFRLCGGLYCADSRYVSTIMELPEYTTLPDAPPYITGIFPYRGSSVTMFDLRAALKQPSLSDEFSDFCKMLDARKQDHIDWVNAFEHSIESGEHFSLAADPHKCKLGKWYDTFKTDSSVLSTHLAKLEDPHRKLHELAISLEHQKEPGQKGAPKDYQALYQKAHGEYMPKVLDVLEEAKEIFRTREFHEMVLVLSGNTHLGLVVDEILSVETVEEEQQGSQQLITYSPYIRRIVKSPNKSELILEIDLPAVLNAGEPHMQTQNSAK